MLDLITSKDFEKAKEICGSIIWVDRKLASSLKKDEYYSCDINLCNVYQKDVIIGKVKSVIDGAASDFIEIECKDGHIIIVPFIERFFGDVNIKQKEIFLKENFIIP